MLLFHSALVVVVIVNVFLIHSFQSAALVHSSLITIVMMLICGCAVLCEALYSAST